MLTGKALIKSKFKIKRKQDAAQQRSELCFPIFSSLLRFYELTERMTKMEGTIGPISNKLDSILEKIDDVKRVKKQKKDAMATFITNIEEDSNRKYQIPYFLNHHN